MQFLVSALPIALLFVLMLRFRLPGHLSALVTLVATVVLGLFASLAAGMVPAAGMIPAVGSVAPLVGWSLVEGVLKAVFPILLIIVMAMYSYNILVESRQIECIKRQFISLTDDKGILVLIMVWGFGGLLEGMSGFGTAVAIPAAILIGLGFKPMFSAVVALLGNTVATGFAAVGVPVTTLCNEAVSGGNASAAMVREVSGFTVMQLSPLFFLIPFAILMLTNRRLWRRNILLALWVGGVSFAAQWACAVWLGAETPAIIGSIAAILALIVAAKAISGSGQANIKRARPSIGASIRAWSVYIIILLLILCSGSLCPPIRNFLAGHLVSVANLPVLGSTFRFGWISNAAFLIFLGSVIGGMIQGLSPKRLGVVLARTVISLKTTALTIVALISMASVMNHTGMINAMAVGIVAMTGKFYPVFAPLIGAVGTFVTGSDTSSNILFAKLQVNVAHNLGFTGQSAFMGLTGSESNWLLAANTTGATGGKMISPQSIAIATAACGLKNSDHQILRALIPYALAYTLVTGLLIYVAS